VQRTGDGRTGQVLGGRTIDRLGDAVWSAPCTRRRGARVSWLSLKIECYRQKLTWSIWAKKPAAIKMGFEDNDG
jgi:hypothetical protein